MTSETSPQPVTQNEPWTVKRILDWTTGHLQKQGCETARLDAEILLAHARGCRRIELYTRYQEILSDEQRSRMRELVRRRAQAEPVAYLVGHREFFSLDFVVTPDVFIPRPDTETLVMETLERVREIPAPRILELGAGSGCIPVAIAVNCPASVITSTEISEAALAIAAENARRHNVGERVRFLQGDLFAPLEGGVTFDVIVSNPPYVAESEREGLQPEVRLHEPEGALFAGPEGFDVICRIVSEAPRFLAPGGALLLEIAPEQAQAVAELLAENGAYGKVSTHKDLGGLIRVVAARKVGYKGPPG